ncbi:Rv0361 family membrane protein [[Mycobacterium] nativiensis]|uniref:Nuclear transport factor 2 family protein n=1 Tax=[Mycobacterium] nativiensis TaxID=2855503 RepID=A0ABU5XYV6_9MYCO|nr:nuclear transport factor 2 family protein [Mycolicibacter sp. MYC340]MEB3033073.1 nuclear transport factor 2 family protein [Mycolicibacter sp. MYC340]
MKRRIWVCAVGAVLLAGLGTSCSTTTAGRPVAGDSAAVTTTGAAPSGPAELPPPPPTAASDEDQIREAIRTFQDAYNVENWDAYRQMMCPAMRDQFTGPIMEMVKKGRTDNGLTDIAVVGVEIDGDRATVTLDSQNEAVGRLTVTLPLERSDGWKICQVN